MLKLSATNFLVLDHIHCRAICDEIGERFGTILKPDTSELPPLLSTLMEKLAELESGEAQSGRAPSIVPCIEEMLFPQSRETVGVD
jgi:hypothetical protein